MATYVLLHGGWDGGWAWTPVARRLRAAGHEAFTPTLTGSGERVHLANPERDLTTQVQDVVNVLLYEDLHEVVLVGSSSGGMVITGVAEQVPERLSQLIYLDAFVPQDGESIFDMIGPEGGAALAQVAEQNGDGWRIPYHDPTDAQKTDVMLKVGLQPLALGNPDAARLPRTYVLFTNKPDDDWLAPVFAGIAARLREDEAWVCLERPWVHYPVLDQPDGVEKITHLLIEVVASDA
jgi:pimeloyl-ACP methyl ester carboxylesterase